MGVVYYLITERFIFFSRQWYNATSIVGNWTLQSSCCQGHENRENGWDPQRQSCQLGPPRLSLHTPGNTGKSENISFYEKNNGLYFSVLSSKARDEQHVELNLEAF